MSLPKMTTPVNNISLLDDLPNAVGGLSAAELKARFDKAGGDIQTFLNETLIPAIEQMGVAEGTARDEAIQAAIDALELDTTVENLQKAIVAAESRSKEYADTKDAANLAAAKQYADTKAATARAAAENTAARDAASKADAALSNAKSYTDDKAAAVLAEAALVSGSDAQNAETAAKQYADKQDAATLTAAKEYTDGKIPSKLPNPQKLKFTGAVSGEYDGSEEKTIDIPTGGGDVPAVLGNLAAQIGDAAAGTIPVYAGDEAWALAKLIEDYTGDEDLIGYIPYTTWVAAYLSKNKVQRVDAWGGKDGIASLAVNMPIGICEGRRGTPPQGMYFPALLIFAEQAYGKISYTALDAKGAVWSGDISLVDYSVTANKEDARLTEADKKAIAALVAADGTEFALSDFPTALKNPNALTFTGAATGTYDGSAALTVNIPAGGASGSGGALKAMSAVDGYIGIPAAELPENGMVWMCFGSGDSTELYTGTVTIQDAGIAVNDMLVITNGTVNPLNQVSWVSDGLAIYGLSPSDYRGVWQQVGAGGGGGSGSESWALVAETTAAENVNMMHVTFDACSAVAIEFYWGGVENDLGNIGIFPNAEGVPYTGEYRLAAANVKSSTAKKCGVLCVQIDCRVGSHWYATSWQKDRGDGSFGAIDASKHNNLDVGLNGSAQYSLISNYYMTPRNDAPANGVRSITAYGAGMAIGTTLKVWGIKK